MSIVAPKPLKFWSLHVNGRARFALAAALLIPPAGVAWNLAWNDSELEWRLLVLLWVFFAFASLLFAYIVLVIGRFLAWARDGMTDPEWRAAKVGAWMLFAVTAVTTAGVVAISKFQAPIRPEKRCCTDSCQEFRVTPSWQASTNDNVEVPGPGAAIRV